MPAIDVAEMGVERGAYETQQRAPVLGNVQGLTIAPDQPVTDELGKRRHVGKERFGRRTVTATDITEIDREIAHQLLDRKSVV